MKPSQILFAILILAGACSLSPASDAQSGGTGGLTVTVTDPSGGVIVGRVALISIIGGLGSPISCGLMPSTS